MLVSFFLDVLAITCCLSVANHYTCRSLSLLVLSRYTLGYFLHTHINPTLFSRSSHTHITLLPYIRLFYSIVCVQTHNPIPVLYYLSHVPTPDLALVINRYGREVQVPPIGDGKMISWMGG
jgi:hypothetical protein